MCPLYRAFVLYAPNQCIRSLFCFFSRPVSEARFHRRRKRRAGGPSPPIIWGGANIPFAPPPPPNNPSTFSINFYVKQEKINHKCTKLKGKVIITVNLLRRHVPAGNLPPLPPPPPPNILNLGSPNILNLPTPMGLHGFVYVFISYSFLLLSLSSFLPVYKSLCFLQLSLYSFISICKCNCSDACSIFYMVLYWYVIGLFLKLGVYGF